MSYKIAFFDIDGTLVDEEKRIPADAIEAIRRLKERGIEPVIATGRAPYFFKALAEEVGIESYVSMNGAYVKYKGQDLHESKIALEVLEKLVGLAQKHKHELVFEGKSAYFSTSPEHPFVFEAIASLRVEHPGLDADFWRKEGIYQVFLHCESHEEQLYATELPELRFVRWHAKALDVLPNTGSKAEGIKALLDRLGIKPEEAIAFGDGLNDKEMLQLVGLGIAMGNSHAELLPYADYVTTAVDEGGVKNGLEYAGVL
ncbi:Cof-type HAD-IIB family hydrolase [Cohnella thailandensis]|uniref:Cof-type HAD-IIB family hydrolase n=1 Tax=Cohnella thailandensis TaxID=557557 RepID=A0A841T1F2_9BACL|nr:Cof-type HAD-IIB family hydrolase [Cohnella thailandensis]MBB6634901.1 Cof-type HAD-IIB family hydrolase [Cohnella thailandensis]MBP1975877.1 Cof subfamily protein (haloacid dehalogenase superfamily) [Cohnella thailandensis]